MSDSPENHPAVVLPKKVLGNNAALTNTAPLNSTAQKNPNSKTPTRNAEEQLLDLLYPNQMQHVQVAPMRTNPNLLVKSVGYGAWTQSRKLIYYEYRMPEYLKPFILFHEGMHIKQFMRNPGAQPNSFRQMLGFELQTYKKTDDWIRNESRSKSFYSNNPIAAKYGQMKSESASALAATNKVFLLSAALKIGWVAKRQLNFLLKTLGHPTISTASSQMTFEQIVFQNMENAQMIPALKPGKQVYTAKDLYNQTSDPAFYEKFGY